MKAKYAAGAQPWKAAIDGMKASSFASLTWTPLPRDSVICSGGSQLDIGCHDQRYDSQAAYADALLWYYTGNIAYANRAIQILNAWSNMLKAFGDKNAPLQAAWSGGVFCRAAEILRYSNSGWSATDISSFSAMLTNIYKPLFMNGACGHEGNWDLTMMDALADIGVFLDDTTTFNTAIVNWRKRLPAYFYLTADGAFPVAPPNCGITSQADLAAFWFNQTTYVDGLSQETCRDFHHVQMGMAAALMTAETALHQGIDLYSEQQTRLVAAMELHAKYLLGTQAPSTLCGGSPTVSGETRGTWEIGYNHFHSRKGVAMPQTLDLITANRKSTDVNISEPYNDIAWEMQTHAELNSIGGTTQIRQFNSIKKTASQATVFWSRKTGPSIGNDKEMQMLIFQDNGEGTAGEVYSVSGTRIQRIP